MYINFTKEKKNNNDDQVSGWFCLVSGTDIKHWKTRITILFAVLKQYIYIYRVYVFRCRQLPRRVQLQIKWFIIIFFVYMYYVFYPKLHSRGGIEGVHYSYGIVTHLNFLRARSTELDRCSSSAAITANHHHHHRIPTQAARDILREYFQIE